MSMLHDLILVIILFLVRSCLMTCIIFMLCALFCQKNRKRIEFMLPDNKNQLCLTKINVNYLKQKIPQM